MKEKRNLDFDSDNGKEKKKQISNSWFCQSYQKTCNQVLLPKTKADQ